jgi:quinolinate synthase
MRREILGKTFLPVNKYAECPTMKRITLRNTYEALLNDGPEVRVSPEVAGLALRPIERMLEMSR